mmetsp:Transcript_12669/g.28451  ORF Transcript_12669/g.28451 Transcript_12669/m.28451 type:complete len:314 (-) Transcript_12669:42-983(-)
MPLAFRLRLSNGQNVTLENVPEDAKVADLQELIAEKLSLPASRQLLKVGFPAPQVLPQDATGKLLSEVGLGRSGVILVEDALAARIAGLIQQHDVPPATPGAAVLEVERHVVPSDNSCLFASVAYLLRGESAPEAKSPQELRNIVAKQILADPERWDVITQVEANKAYREYSEWISQSTSWGGSVDLMVLAEELGVQLSAVDIKTLRTENYPYEGPYKHRAYLLYDGIHYDAVVGRKDPGRNEVRIFDPSDDGTMSKVMALAEELQRKRQFTDTAGFTLQCQQCFALLTGEAEAQKHGNETGHFNFQEVSAAR